MKTTLVLVTISALWTTLAMAYPRPGPPPPGYDVVRPRAGENGTDIDQTSGDDEPVPVFVLPCDCPAPVCYPMMNAKSVSVCFVLLSIYRFLVQPGFILFLFIHCFLLGGGEVVMERVRVEITYMRGRKKHHT